MILPSALIWASSLAFLVAIYYTLKLARETEGEDYWIFLLIVALAFGIMHVMAKIPPEWNIVDSTTRLMIIEISEIVGELALAYLTYRLYKAMKTIREKMREG